jgi:hypothetical protein
MKIDSYEEKEKRKINLWNEMKKNEKRQNEGAKA